MEKLANKTDSMTAKNVADGKYMADVIKKYAYSYDASGRLTKEAEISEGQKIGEIGESGFGVEMYTDYGSHLHYEIIVDGKNINPAASRKELKDAQKILYPIIDNNLYQGGELNTVVATTYGTVKLPQLLPQMLSRYDLPDYIPTKL